MVIRPLHAEKLSFLYQAFSALIPAHPIPLSPLSLISSIRPLCVLQSLQQSAHLENPQLQNSVSSDTQTHAHSH